MPVVHTEMVPPVDLGGGAAGSAPGSSVPSVPSVGAGGSSAPDGGVAAALTGPSGGPAMPPSAAADPPGTVMLKTDPFLLKAGEETYKCQNFDNPFGGKDAAVYRIASDMELSHHLHLYHAAEGAQRTLEDCDSSDFHPLVFTASAPHNEITYPSGMAAKVLGQSGMRIQLHHINTGEQDRMVSATVKLSPTDYASVTKWVSELYFNQLGLKVAPGMNQVVTTTCTIPDSYGPIGLIAGYTHMHKRGVHFTAQTSAGTMLADVNTWDEPPTILYPQPIMLNPGDKITWTCTYNNDTGRTLMFGDSAETNEMCIYLARFFSAPDGSQLECQITSPTGTARKRTM